MGSSGFHRRFMVRLPMRSRSPLREVTMLRLFVAIVEAEVFNKI